jgi:hypothetical protein
MLDLHGLPVSSETESPAVASVRRIPPLARSIHLLTQISKFGGLLTGLGALVLYSAGISVYVVGSALFGVEPFEFGLTKCLESGALSVSSIVLVSPLLPLLGRVMQ